MKNIKILSLYLLLPLFLSSCGGEQRTDTLDTQQQNSSSTTNREKPAKPAKVKTIVFFGNSLTAGYGLEPDQAFPALLQERIDSLNLSYKVVNAGVSGETSAGGKSRVDWLLKQPIDVFVLELGANDGLRGINPDDTYKNLAAIIDKVRGKYPDAEVLLAGMQMPPSMGQQFAQDFRNVFTRLAREKDAILIPFLLEGVAGNRELNQGDGIHPTVEGQKILADNVWAKLEPVLREESEAL